MPDPVQGLVAIAREFGPYVAVLAALLGIVAFFLWRDWKRESGLVERLRDLEEFNRDKLVKLYGQSVRVHIMTINTLNRMIEVIAESPCIAPKMDRLKWEMQRRERQVDLDHLANEEDRFQDGTP